MRLSVLAAGLLLVACAPAAPESSLSSRAPVTQPSPAEQVVQAQLEAYNRRDLDAFLATYADDLTLYEHPDRVTTQGKEAAREVYGRLFAAVPDLRATVATRIVQGNFVIDHEVVTGLPNRPEMRAVAIYEVRDGKIKNVWFIQ